MLLIKHKIALAINVYICPLFLLLCLMFIIGNKIEHKTMYIPCSACHKLWKAIQFSHIHNVLKSKRGDVGSGRKVRWYPIIPISLFPQESSPWLRSILWVPGWSNPASVLRSERIEGNLQGKENSGPGPVWLTGGSTPPLRWSDKGTADYFTKRTWDLESKIYVQIPALSKLSEWPRLSIA